MKFDWILFDADETLFHFDAFTGLKTMFSAFDVDFTAEDFNQYQAQNQQLWRDYQDGKIDAATLKHQRFTTWATRLGQTTEALNLHFFQAMAEISTLLPGARALLEQLRGQAQLGIITNGFIDLQSHRLEKHGLTDYFAQVTVSEQVGVAKPDPAIFAYTHQQIGYPDKSRVLMVGDNPVADIQGGHQYGFTTCWLNSDQQSIPDHVVCHYEIQSLTELSAVIFA
ncbi:pyrimidine 5'-nucleotidase [Vibrio gazogenes]|uniref:Putative hydrolase of the HAD superfamily n=1 Tax=Vibrio gazogenes DSM 21264 = NBRC 103151 TaxID=1123492 RepID=A0A1M5C7X7_VIBGA|nr:pyrimidine 5'-nucleotidase [Vibrio gazogenes]USP16302.1 pyrimidine 5'-nucleotidase [Vibrio gazogenes]SHF50825.1 putative hydrolase of the HAD superfamily [Vibrio gazogenes DSM 21264] [Vibrio gazogenes DSM 21264 = NBRC 103151]